MEQGNDARTPKPPRHAVSPAPVGKTKHTVKKNFGRVRPPTEGNDATTRPKRTRTALTALANGPGPQPKRARRRPETRRPQRPESPRKTCRWAKTSPPKGDWVGCHSRPGVHWLRQRTMGLGLGAAHQAARRRPPPPNLHRKRPQRAQATRTNKLANNKPSPRALLRGRLIMG